MGQTARRTAVATLVAGAIVVVAVALWKLKLLLALILFGFIIAAAVRPGVDWLARRRIPRPAGVAIHYIVFAALIGLLLWLVVPRAITQISQAVGSVPTSSAELRKAAALAFCTETSMPKIGASSIRKRPRTFPARSTTATFTRA